MWYWPNALVAWLSRKLSVDTAFRVYVYFILAHYLLASFIAYQVMGLFGALTLTYAGYCIKPQTPCFVFTMTWMPGMLIGGPFGWLSCAMAITGGYWPILVYFLPVAAIVNPSCLWGLILAAPQIIAFAWYWPKSVRAGKIEDRGFGRLPWWKLKDLFWPTDSVALVKGVHYPEAAMYMGIAILFIWTASWWWIPLVLSVLVCLGILNSVQHIPARSLHLLTISVCLLTQDYDLGIPLITLQAFLLLRNSSNYPSFPFSQWWNCPSKLYQRTHDGAWPHITGYLINKRISSYQGAFRLKDAPW